MAASTEFIALTDTLMGLADDLLEHPITDGEYKTMVEGVARIRILHERVTPQSTAPVDPLQMAINEVPFECFSDGVMVTPNTIDSRNAMFAYAIRQPRATTSSAITPETNIMEKIIWDFSTDIMKHGTAENKVALLNWVEYNDMVWNENTQRFEDNYD